MEISLNVEALVTSHPLPETQSQTINVTSNYAKQIFVHDARVHNTADYLDRSRSRITSVRNVCARSRLGNRAYLIQINMPQDLKEYTESLIAFLEEKEKEYSSQGLIPTLKLLIDELKESV